MEINKIIFILFVFTSNIIASSPNWLFDEDKNFIYGIGISNEKNIAMRERIAIVSARANLAENISVEINSYFKLYKSIKNDKIISKSESLIEQKTHKIILNSKIKKRFVDKNGTLYILIIMPKKILNLQNSKYKATR